MSAWIEPLAVLLWLAGCFYFALIRYSLVDFSRSRLEEICEQKNKQDRFGEILKQHVVTLYLTDMTLLCLVCGGLSVVLHNSDWSYPGTSSFTNILFTGLMILMFIFGLSLSLVILPGTISHVMGERCLFYSWPLLKLLNKLGAPLRFLFVHSDKFVHRLAGLQDPSHADSNVITEEIQSVIEEGQREGLLEDHAGTMISRVMELSQQDTASVMTPRTDMFCIHVDSNLDDILSQLKEAGHSRIPIIGENTDDLIGILYAKDLLLHSPNEEQPFNLRESGLIRKPLYVPETTHIDTLLETMKKERIHMAIVVDEYGGVAGLVCMEDILEEIVGEIDDEYDDQEESGISILSPTETELDARLHIDDLNEQFDFGLPEDGDYDTLGGFILTQLNRVPQVNESFTWNHLNLKILNVEKRKIDRVYIEVTQAQPDALAENQ